MKEGESMSGKHTAMKLVFSLLAAIQAAALLCAALIRQGAIPFPTPVALVLAALGAVCFLCLIVFGYGSPGNGKAKPAKPEPQPIREELPWQGREVIRPAAQRLHDGTSILFEESGSGQQGYGETVLVDRRQGLCLTWEIEGIPHRVERYDFPVTIGRDLACSMVINAQSVSRRHALLTSENDEFFISDMQSSNGTLLNGKRTEGAVRVDDGDEITFGRVTVKVSIV